MELTIYTPKGQPRLHASLHENSVRQKQLMGDDVLSLTFTAFEPVPLAVYDYAEWEGERFWALEPCTPKQVSPVEWEYNVRLYGSGGLARHALVLHLSDGEDEPRFSLTAPARDHVALIAENLNRQSGTTDWKTGEVADAGNLTVEYAGTTALDALARVAEAAGTEWWFDGMTLNLCRCERGEEVTLGCDDGLVWLEPQSDEEPFFTRLFPVGSTRNIDPSRYGHSRLMLPGGRKWVEHRTEEGIIERYEEEAFAAIYPRRTGTLSRARAEERTTEGRVHAVWFVGDEGLPFDPNEYRIAGLTMRLTFETGELAGRDFEVNFDTDRGEFELITQWPYDEHTPLPGGYLVPKAGDRYILWNIRMPDAYYAAAEEELFEAATAYLAGHDRDPRVYKAATDYVALAERGLALDVGQRVRLESAVCFPGAGFRLSRITAFTQQLVRPTDIELQISDAAPQSTLRRIEQEVDRARHYAEAASAALPEVIRSWEQTPASDSNLYSARRTHAEFLSRRENDSARGVISFEEGLRLGSATDPAGALDGAGDALLRSVVARGEVRSERFREGLTGEGWRLGEDAERLSEMEVDRLTVRQTMRVMELLLERVRAVGGEMIVSAAAGRVASVERAGDDFLVRFETGCPFRAGDWVRCAVRGGKSYWVAVAAVEEDTARIPAAAFGETEPAAGDECVLLGSADPRRQGALSIAASEEGPRIDLLDGISAPTLAGCLRARLGDLSGLTDTLFGDRPEGYGLYADNVYLRGSFCLATGEEVSTRFEAIEGRIRSTVESIGQELDRGFLASPNFRDGLRGWEPRNDVSLLRTDGRWLRINGAPYADKRAYATVVEDAGRSVLVLVRGEVRQPARHLKARPTYEALPDGLLAAKPVFLTFFYACDKAGEMEVSFEGCDTTGFAHFRPMRAVQRLEAAEGYRTFACSGLWNGTGELRIAFSGRIRLYDVVLREDRAEELIYSHRTLFEQDDQLVRIATESFDADGNLVNTTGLVSRADAAGLYAVAGDGTLRSLVGATTEGVKIKADNIDMEGLVKVNENFLVREDGSIEARNGLFHGTIEASEGQIGGFELASGRIGSAATPEGETGGLAIYDDFIRVGGEKASVLFGNDVIPASAGGAFSAAGRIINNKPNTGAEWGYDSANYGLYIEVTGGTKNYGIQSNAPLSAPGFINTRLQRLDLIHDTYSIDFSQSVVFAVYANVYRSVTLPNEQHVAEMFSLKTLPEDFAAFVLFKIRAGSKHVIFKGVYNQNESLTDLELAQGDTVTLMISKIDGFRYNIVQLTL